jgi:hypothetical protein
MKQFAKAAMSSMSGPTDQNQNHSNINDLLNKDTSRGQREMQGPPNIDDILKQISEENGDDSADTLKTINLDR